MISQIFSRVLNPLEGCSELRHVDPESDIFYERFSATVVVVASPSHSYQRCRSFSNLLFHVQFFGHKVSLLLFVVVLNVVGERYHHERNDDVAPNTQEEGHHSSRESSRIVVSVSDGRHCDHDPPETVDVRVESYASVDLTDRQLTDSNGKSKHGDSHHQANENESEGLVLEETFQSIEGGGGNSEEMADSVRAVGIVLDAGEEHVENTDHADEHQRAEDVVVVVLHAETHFAVVENHGVAF